MKTLMHLIVLSAVVAVVGSCQPAATPTPSATSTPEATATAEPTPTQSASVGEWIHGHFWSIKVTDVRTETELDGEVPTEDLFLVVEVAYKADRLTMKHRITGGDFQLIDQAGQRYDIDGMIYEDEKGGGESFHRGWWQAHEASGSPSGAFKLVYDLPASARGLRLWFRDLLPMIDVAEALSKPQNTAAATGDESAFDLNSALAEAITSPEPQIHTDEENIPVTIFASGAEMTIADRLSLGNAVMLSDPTDPLTLRGTETGTVRVSGKGAVVVDGDKVYLFGISLPAAGGQ